MKCSIINAPRLVNALARRIEPMILNDKPAADVYKVVLSVIADAKIVDAAPVIHANWIFGDIDICGCSVECSNCGYGKQLVNKKTWLEYPGNKFCGSCGAQMGGAEDGKYYKENELRCDHPELNFDVECYDHWIDCDPDDFCSSGKRREGGLTMNERDIAEQAYNNGYEKGYADGKSKVMREIAFPRFLVRQPELSKKDVEDISMQSPTIIMDKTEIIPIYPYRWIQVTERLPEVGQRILVYCESKTIEMHITTCTYMAGRYGSKQFSRHVRNVTHWMPLPPCPKTPEGE